MGTGDGAAQVQSLLTTGQPLTESDRANVPKFADLAVHWALMNLRMPTQLNSRIEELLPHRWQPAA